MHIFCISVYIKSDDHSSAKLFCSVKDLKGVGLFQKSNVIEFIDFFGKTIIDRISHVKKECIIEKDYKCHAFISDKNIGCVVITDEKYPSVTSFRLINLILSNFSDNKIETEIMFKNLLEKYQKPENIDPIKNLNNELDSTKQILYKNLESLLKRGEQLDDLIEKSRELSTSSKIFYIKTKKMNSCCMIL